MKLIKLKLEEIITSEARGNYQQCSQMKLLKVQLDETIKSEPR